MNTAKLISHTQSCVTENPDGLIAYCARVSNPSNQMNTKTAPDLISYLIRHKHWSPFQMSYMCVEVKTTRAIGAQILRHTSMDVQEFSQRYSEVTEVHSPTLRMRGDTNRQGSLEDADSVLQEIGDDSIKAAHKAYYAAISAGIAPESARMLLPLATPTTMYVNGSVRSWIHYFEQRCSEHTQKEHRDVANSIKDIFIKIYPNVSKALNYG